MLQYKRNQSAFTLIELLVVVIIVAILAAVGVPLLSANVKRARATEAETGLGAIRTGLRAYFAEFGTYVGATMPLIGLNVVSASNNDDLGGQFFDDNDYAFQALGTSTFCISVTGGLGTDEAPGHAKVTGGANQITESMNQDGTIFTTSGSC